MLVTSVVVVKYSGYSGMGQRCGMPGFGPEPGQRLRMLGVLGAKQLDGYGPIQHDVHGPPHVTSAADRDPVVELVSSCQHGSYLSHAYLSTPI